MMRMCTIVFADIVRGLRMIARMLPFFALYVLLLYVLKILLQIHILLAIAGMILILSYAVGFVMRDHDET
jgi:hypothetical protein